MRQINLYRYAELTDEAKKKARDWYIKQQADDPICYEDHFKSMEEAIKAVNAGFDKETLIIRSKKCDFTGYIADSFLSDMIYDKKMIPSAEDIRERYNYEWEKEQYFNSIDIEMIEGELMLYGKDFMDDGRKY